MILKAAFLLAYSLICFSPAVSAEGAVSTLSFTKEDRVLVLAPHPDDESIGTAGIIQKALSAGAKVKVILMTNGENNEFAFIVYEKRLVFRKKEFLHLGEVRRQESLAAMEYLGVDPASVVSLGYPDFGTMELFTRYWGNDTPFKSMLSRVRSVPYETAYAPGSPYLGDNVLRDLKRLIFEYKPTKVFVSHPADANRDHRALYLFTRVALWDLEDKMPGPKEFPYIIHVANWPLPRGYSPDKPLDVPLPFVHSAIEWFSVGLDRLMIQHKRNAIEFYQSQVKSAPKYLTAFARSTELFGDYPPVRLERQMASVVDWKGLFAENIDVTSKISGRPDHISTVEYARQGDYLLVKVRLKRFIDRELGASLFLFGYRKDMPFASMPKIELHVGIDGLTARDKRKRIQPKDVLMTQDGKELVFRIPLSFMGSPERVLTCVKTLMYDMTLDETAWRTLILKQKP